MIKKKNLDFSFLQRKVIPTEELNMALPHSTTNVFIFGKRQIETPLEIKHYYIMPFQRSVFIKQRSLFVEVEVRSFNSRTKRETE